MTDCQHPTHYIVELSGKMQGAATEAKLIESDVLDFSHLSTETLYRACVDCGEVLEEDERFEQICES